MGVDANIYILSIKNVHYLASQIQCRMNPSPITYLFVYALAVGFFPCIMFLNVANICHLKLIFNAEFHKI